MIQPNLNQESGGTLAFERGRRPSILIRRDVSILGRADTNRSLLPIFSRSAANLALWKHVHMGAAVQTHLNLEVKFKKGRSFLIDD